MKRGVPPTPRKARTGLFTPPGITCWAAANSSVERAVFACTGVSVMRLFPFGEPASGGFGKIGNDQVGARAFDRGEAFQRGAALVDPAALSGGLEHGVLAAHLVGGQR